VSPACPLCIDLDTNPSEAAPERFFTDSLCRLPRLGIAPLRVACGKFPSSGNSRIKRWNRPREEKTIMSVLDGVSLVLATGLFIYLLVALLRADRS
jgi:K+-transporting ATPase ATPase F chain